MSNNTSKLTASGGTAKSAEEADANVLNALDPQTSERIERVRAFADEVRDALRTLRRNAHGLSQGDLAERLGVSTSTISRLESGRGLSGLDMQLVLLTFAELGASPMLTLLDANAPGASQVVDFTTWPDTANSKPGHRTPEQLRNTMVETETMAASFQTGQSGSVGAESLDAVAYGLQSELKAMRMELSRLSDCVGKPDHKSAPTGGTGTGSDKASASGASG
jgi:DNA-binding transcriptional regulator YiaG